MFKLKNILFEREENLSNNNVVILMGGLDTRKGDLNIKQQVNKLQTRLPANCNVIGHRYTALKSVLASIIEYPNSIVVLFSAGCGNSSTVAKAMSNKTNLYIVEPYAKSSNTVASVTGAVQQGVPTTNVLLGSSIARGKGTVAGATTTPDIEGGLMASHWNALTYVGGLIANKINKK